jgi:hypothetical protein
MIRIDRGAEQSSLRRIRAHWLECEQKVSARLLEFCERAIRAFPHSAALLCTFGDLLTLYQVQFSSPRRNWRFLAMDPLKFYRQAAESCPAYYDAHESAGYHYYTCHDLPRAQAAFRRAIRYGGGLDSFIGLALVLLERGRRKQAKIVLHDCGYAPATIRRRVYARDLISILPRNKKP